MKKLAIGILAHVDAGKTTLSEGLLYESGCIKKLGRVDHQDAFLDTNFLERERGITIFSKLAVLPLDDLIITLLDTPGHVDFSTEMERTLQVLDYAILVISGTDGVQSHTQTLWRLLRKFSIPTFIFINKMDLAGADANSLLSQLKKQLHENCVDFTQPEDKFTESLAVCDESLLDEYLQSGTLSQASIADKIKKHLVFPCFFGSALKLNGVGLFLNELKKYTVCPDYPDSFGARVYKIARDPQGNRLTYLKVTGGILKMKALVSNYRPELSSEETWEEKIDQIRIYSGSKYQTAEEASAGTICAVTGLSKTRPGDGLGFEVSSDPPQLEPVLTYKLILPPAANPHKVFLQLMQLEEEDPLLHIIWNDQYKEIHLQLMGEVQLEILKRLIKERFSLEVEFGNGSIVYKESIAAPVEGIGHYEPLRHYAEVHLLLEPLDQGSGLQFACDCQEEMLELSWQRLILTHLQEKVHLGVLTGSPITDMKITLIAGRAHQKHTEGGDFRQATYRAVRQGLMSAQSILLEPWYYFQLTLPTSSVGRALADLERMCCKLSPPEAKGEEALITGSAPVSALLDYAQNLASYTKGAGRLSCTFKDYEPCHNQKEIISQIGYDSERDLENTADSVFCAHGAGFVVKWNQVQNYMHIDGKKKSSSNLPPADPLKQQTQKASRYSSTLEQDRELLSIYEKTYGPIKQRFFFRPLPSAHAEEDSSENKSPIYNLSGPEYLLVDGYNIIFAWDDLKKVAEQNLDDARKLLMDLLCNYQGYRNQIVIVVFDAYKVHNGTGEISNYENITVVYTKEAETADAYIEKATYEIGKKHRVKVATSDSAEQLIILGHGALRLSARSFRAELEEVNGQISEILNTMNRQKKSYSVQYAFDHAKKNRKK